MSKSSSDVERWIEEAHRLYQQQQQETWSEIDERRYTAVMDKKPELHYGVDFVNNIMPMPPFIVEPFFPAGGLCLLHGKRGLGKTMLAMTLTHSVATGTPFLDTYPVTQGTVVYIQLDMTDNVFQERLRSAGDFYGFEDWYTLTGVASIGRAKSDTPWVQDIMAVQPSLIIIDTLRKAHSWSENDSDSAGRFYAKLRELFGYVSVVMVHHDRKSSEHNIGLSEEAFRGSGAWLDDVDCGLHLIKKGRTGMQLEFSKVRTCPDIPTTAVKIDEDTLTITLSESGDVGLSRIDNARAQARGYIMSKAEAPSRQAVYQHLVAAGHPKPRASIVAKELCPPPPPKHPPISLRPCSIST